MTNILLYSGGLDSFIAYHLLREDGTLWQPVYVDMGTRYSDKELAALDATLVPYIVLHLKDLGAYEQENAFLPQRNLMLLSYVQGAMNADRIALAAVRGEYSRDKHKHFFEKASELLSYTAGKPVECFSPLLRMTKTQALRTYIKHGHSVERLATTVSCYDARHRACGACMSCYRRWVAYENNGLEADWAFPPWQWIRRNHSPLGTAGKLPVSQLLDFCYAQLDAARAHVSHAARRRKIRQ